MSSIVLDWELPRCGGRASPEVIDNTCIDENETHHWKTYRDYYYGERIVVCSKCGFEL